MDLPVKRQRHNLRSAFDARIHVEQLLERQICLREFSQWKMQKKLRSLMPPACSSR